MGTVWRLSLSVNITVNPEKDSLLGQTIPIQKPLQIFGKNWFFFLTSFNILWQKIIVILIMTRVVNPAPRFILGGEGST